MGDSPENSDDLPWKSDEQGAEQPSAAELEAAGQNALFGGNDEPAPDEVASGPKPSPEAVMPVSAPKAQPSEQPSQPYRVLARKYRPQTFSELIGQEPMVRTLANAIERDRLAHAFLMTGVRGVGKTSTARLIAKALNCIGPDGQGGPTIDPCGVCEPCVAIAEGRHIDVIEMDAASHTGVDDVREIIEAVRYSAVSARYKIYIIDEVHMLSRNAFNALLKTLEEPPAHVKFLFATTEVDKLPVTVLSRTQRFDLRRIPAEMLQDHFGEICRKENVEAEDEALHIIANAAEGSVRDGLSILDQAIAHADLESDGTGAGIVTGERVRDMLGLADKGAQRRMLRTMLDGDGKALLAAVADQYALGVEPLALMRSLMDLVHKITITQISGGEPDAPTADERTDLLALAERLSAPQLHRLWQLLLKGYEEVRQAPDPLVSAQMALLRVLHAVDLPDPGKLARQLKDLAENGVRASAAGANPAGVGPENGESGATTANAIDWSALVQQVEDAGQLRVAQLMRDWIRVVELSDGRLVYRTAEGLKDDPGPDLRDAMFKLTGNRWQIEMAADDAAETQPSLRERAEAEKAEADAKIRAHPLVKATLEAYPDAEILETEKVAQGGGGNWSR